MKAAILGLLAETSIHPGAGSSVGVVDLPVAREAATDYPVLVGSSLKGALRGAASKAADSRFGDKDSAGELLVSDARLLLLPVRSLTGAYRWVTCPHLLERYERDQRRAGRKAELPIFRPPKGGVMVADGEGLLFLEERELEIKVDAGRAAQLAAALNPLVLHSAVKGRLKGRLAVLHDDDFAWFARYGLAVQARNQLKDNKQSNNLWYEETLPPDTLMYALLLERVGGALAVLDEIFPEAKPYLQAGGNETVGQGWFAVSVLYDNDARPEQEQ